MNRLFFAKLAASNMKKNRKTYIPYILTCILTIAMFYILKSLSLNPGMAKMVGSETLDYFMMLGSWVVGLFAFIFLFYTNSFLVKRRKKEFGVFNILGMEKRHLSIVLGWETVYTVLFSLVVGIVFGILLDKVMFLLIGRVLGVNHIVLGFFITPKAIYTTAALFSIIFVLIYINAVRQIHVSNPVELLRAGNAGEKEPKTKWLLAVLGILCIGTGYYIAFVTDDPLTSIFMFFVAVVLVIVGTYMLFTAGSIAFLKLLRQNKGYYYKTKHFTSISGMIYRMKQNAVGLANICILSTMVLVMVSSTSSLMIGMEHILNTRYPFDYSVYSYKYYGGKENEAFAAVKQLLKQEGLHVTKEQQYQYLGISAFRDGDSFSNESDGAITAVSSASALFFVTLQDYNRITGEHKSLGSNEILLHSMRGDFEGPVFTLYGKEYKVAEMLDQFIPNGARAANMSNYQCIVVPDREELDEISRVHKEKMGDIANSINEMYEFSTDAKPEEQKAFYNKLHSFLDSKGFLQWEDLNIESKEVSRVDFISLYGGFFFIGIFLGLLFVMATVLIIYYKQISEGYDDKGRFAIMQKVGMSHAEVKGSIRSQVLMVFFLPLAVAGVHLAAAFPLIARLLALLNFSDTQLYVVCTVSSFLIFAVMYVLIYMLTARTYYRIVSR